MEQLEKFTKTETKIIIIIFLFLTLVFGFNLSISMRKGRDATRKDDLSALQKGLESYLAKYGTYPLSSEDGKIVGCFNGQDPILDPYSNRPVNANACEWGQSNFENMPTLPRDPSYKDGRSYLYISDGENYQIYVSLEGKTEAEYNKETESQNLQCGNQICNYGRGVN